MKVKVRSVKVISILDIGFMVKNKIQKHFTELEITYNRYAWVSKLEIEWKLNM